MVAIMEKIRNMENKEFGVYYADINYINLSERIKILAWDIALFFVIYLGMLALLANISNTIDELYANGRYFMPLVIFVYLAFIKRTSFGGLGYWAVGAELVDIKGGRPSILKTVLRSLFFVFGPFNILIDYLWLYDDQNKQALRDKIVGTYVVRKNAKPCGNGPIYYSKYFIFGWLIMFSEVKRSAI